MAPTRAVSASSARRNTTVAESTGGAGASCAGPLVVSFLLAGCGDLIPRGEVKEWDLRRLGVLKRGLLGLSEKLAPVLEGLTVGEIRAAIRHAVEEILHRFASI